MDKALQNRPILYSRGIKVHQKVGNEAKGGGRSNVKTVKRKCCMLLYFSVENRDALPGYKCIDSQMQEKDLMKWVNFPLRVYIRKSARNA